MTADANVIGKRQDGTVRRYGLEVGKDVRLLHVLATRTGDLAYCGYRPSAVIRPSHQRAVAIERREDQQSRGFEFCRECLREMTPQPDPAIWGPPRPPGP